MKAVTRWGSGVVAVGWFRLQGSGGPGHAAVWTSPDGLAWTRVLPDDEVTGEPGAQGIVSVTVGGPSLVAVGRELIDPDEIFESDGPVWTSTRRSTRLTIQ